MPQILNVAGYQFVPLSALHELRERLHRSARELSLFGTVLLSEEGINLFLAGPPEALRSWLIQLSAELDLTHFPVKESWSSAVPFRRLKVKVKREIIRMDHPAVRPADRRADPVDPATLKRWLDQGTDDEGRDLVLLDTRNGFEVDCGTFNGAVDWQIRRFTEFPDRVVQHQRDFENRRVVTFCTGGIRCEKAAIFMREAGVDHVVQLDGGILKYFEDVGDDHFNGTCFVFDERFSLDGSLVPTQP